MELDAAIARLAEVMTRAVDETLRLKAAVAVLDLAWGEWEGQWTPRS